ncbi:MAG: alpha amylase, partial [Clostridiales bacterium]|nr:alpha amylase [Clostridiales bacterium]
IDTDADTDMDDSDLVSDSDDEDNMMTQIDYKYKQELNIIDDNYRNYYEIFVYSFYDSDGDGIGDIQGLISKLDYINDGDPTTDTDLGFNGIWLMPIMPSTTYHKYDVTDYYSIDSQYGTLEDFKELIEECHKRGINLIIDLVFNHTSAKHPWFMEAVSYLEGLEEGQEPNPKECPFIEYYNFDKDKNGATGYHKAGRSDYYYECIFWDQMPDLALDNENVRGEIEKIARFWLDMGVDGFRLDAVKEFFTGQKDKNTEVLKWFTEYVRSVKEDVYVVGEAWDTKDIISAYYNSGTTSFFNFPLAMHNGEIVKAVRKLGASTVSSFATNLMHIYDLYESSNPNYIDAPFISNHDTTSVSAQCVNNEDQMKMTAGVLLTLDGSPFVYYGEEIGMNSYGDKDENKRLPMNWSNTDQTGMTRKPSNADTVEQKFKAVDEQLEDPLSVLNYYKRAVRIRNENPEIARGETSLIEELIDSNTLALRKNYNGSEIIIIYNINTEDAKFNLSKVGLTDKNIRGYLSVDGREVILRDNEIEMPKYSIVVLK